jgi:D-glycero-D-manno-heptose 1,7-bisphosphate phosphatase
MKNKAIFLDKDGVVCETVLYNGQPCAPRSLSEFKIIPGVAEAIQKARSLGFKVFVCTNQPDIARGDIKLKVVTEMARIIVEDLLVDEVYVCEHQEKDKCFCRKPRPGMLLEAATKWGIDLKNSFMVGDTWRDIDAGKNAGCKTVLIKTKYEADRNSKADLTAKDLAEAIIKIKNYKPKKGEKL